MTSALYEPLAQSAPLAHALAAKHCAQGGCGWYHGVWQYLLLSGLTNSMRSDTEFLLRSFAALALGNRPQRILISGAADYSMLAHVVAAFGVDPEAAHISMIDQCATPLAVNQWYAAQVGLPLETIHTDVLQHLPARPYDLLCTHTFLGLFDESTRHQVLQRWHAAMKPGAKVVTSQRVHPGFSGQQIRFDAAQGAAFIARAADAAATFEPQHQLNGGSLVRFATEYVQRWQRLPIKSEAELVGLFEANGFRIDVLDAADAVAKVADRPSGPTHALATRIRIVATRLA